MFGPVTGDAFGNLLRRCWAAGGAPGRAIEIIERDDGFIGAGDAARYFGGADSWSPHEATILPHVRGRALDIGCGAGRHMIALGERGIRVQGIDPSPGAVAVCRERGLDVSVGDIDGISGGPFDTLMLFGNNLGLLGSPAAAPGRLAALGAVAAPGARILASGIDPYGTADPVHTAYHSRNRDRGRPGGQLRLRVRHADTASEWFDYWLLTVAELEGVLAGSPWRLETVERGPDTDPNYAVVLSLSP
jgi:SAM-dependent methyltransferase